MALEHISSCGIGRGAVNFFHCFPIWFLGKHGETIDFSDVFFGDFPRREKGWTSSAKPRENHQKFFHQIPPKKWATMTQPTRHFPTIPNLRWFPKPAGGAKRCWKRWKKSLNLHLRFPTDHCGTCLQTQHWMWSLCFLLLWKVQVEGNQVTCRKLTTK